MYLFYVKAALPIQCHGGRDNIPCLIGGVIENLDLQQLFRVIKVAYAFNETVDNVQLVEERELDRHPREFRKRWKSFPPAFLSEVVIHHHKSVCAEREQ